MKFTIAFFITLAILISTIFSPSYAYYMILGLLGVLLLLILISNETYKSVYFMVTICVFIVVMPMAKFPFDLIPLWMVDIATGLLLGLSLFRSSSLCRGHFSRNSTDWLVVFYMISIIPSFFVGVVYFGVLSASYVYLRVFLAMSTFYLVRRYLDTSEKMEIFIQALAFLGIVTALFGVFQVLQTDLWITYFGEVFYPGLETKGLTLWVGGAEYGPARAYSGLLQRAYGGHQTPTVFAGLLTLIFPLLIYCGRQNRQWHIGTGVVILALVLTWTRHSWLAIISSFLIATMLQSFKTSSAALKFMLVSLGLVLLLVANLATDTPKDIDSHVQPLDRFISIFQPQSDTSANSRWVSTQRFFEYVLENPSVLLMGSGHSYLVRSGLYDYITPEAEHLVMGGFASNSLLLVLYNYGIICFTLFIIFWIRLFRVYMLSFSTRSLWHKRTASLGFALSSAFILTLSDNYMHMNIHMQSLLWMYFSLFWVNATLESRIMSDTSDDRQRL